MDLDREFQIANIQVLPKRNIIIVDGSELSLEPRVMDVLCYLAQNAPNVVSRTDLIEQLWKVEFGGDESLTRTISVLRKTLASAGVQEVVVETIPKRGYRLVLPVTHIPLASSHKVEGAAILKKTSLADASTSSMPSTSPARSYTKLIGGAAIVGVAAWLAIQYLPSSSSQDDRPLTSETQILRMIEDGHLSVEDAKSLLETVTGSGSQQIVATLETGTSQQKTALKLVADLPTFDQGLNMLEAEATTAADWKLIAELARSRSPERAVEAVRKAIALAPGDFDSLFLLVKSQTESGDFDGARRSHASLKVIAQTPLERLKAAVLEGDLAYPTQRVENANAAINTLTDALEAMEPLEEWPADPRILSPRNDTPFVASEALATRGQLRFQTEEYEKIEPDVLRAIGLLEGDLDRFQRRDLIEARRMLAIYHDLRAQVKHRLNQLEDHHEAHEKAIAQYRAIAETGERSYLDTLYVRLETVAREYADLDEPELAVERMGEAITRFESYAADFPDNQELRLQRFRMNATLAQLKGDYEASQAAFLEGLNFLDDALLSDGDTQKLKWITPFLVRARSVLTRFDDVDSQSIYQLHDAAENMLENFENRYGSSPELEFQIFRNRYQRAGTMVYLDESDGDIRTYAEQILEDSRSENHSNIEPERLERLELALLNIIASTEPADLNAIAKRGLDLAKSLDQRGELPTDEQVYINYFEGLLNAASAPSD